MEFLVVLAVIVLVVGLGLRSVMTRDGRGVIRGPGAGAAGAVHELLNEDKRKAIEIIVENRAAERDHEHADDDVDPATRQLRSRDPKTK